jgi:hypothetical protein
MRGEPLYGAPLAVSWCGPCLREAKVLVMFRREQSMVHNFMLWDLISPACAAAANRAAADLRSALTAASSR